MGLAHQRMKKAATGAVTPTAASPRKEIITAMVNLLEAPGSVQCDPQPAQWWPEFDADELPRDASTMLDWIHDVRWYYGQLAEDGDAEMALVCSALTVVWN